MSIDRALRKLTTGIYIVTTKEESQINGMVASWVSQVSFSPPLIMVAVKKERYSHQMIIKGKVFALNILSTEQKKEVPNFKGTHKSEAKFFNTPYETKKTGAPIIKSSLAYLDCVLTNQFTPGDHTLFIGEVIEGGILKDGKPLSSHELEHIYGGIL